MAERIGIQIGLDGWQEVVSRLKTVEKYGNKLDGKVYGAMTAKGVAELNRELYEVDSCIKKCREELRGFTKEQIKAGEANSIQDEIRQWQAYRNEIVGARDDIKTLDAVKQKSLKLDDAWSNKSLDKVKKTVGDIYRIGGAYNRKGYTTAMKSLIGMDVSDQQSMDAFKTKVKNLTTQIKSDMNKMDRALETSKFAFGANDVGKEMQENFQKARRALSQFLSELNNLSKSKELEFKVRLNMENAKNQFNHVRKNLAGGGRNKFRYDAETNSFMKVPVKLDVDDSPLKEIESEPIPVKVKLSEAYNKWSGNAARVGSSLITLGNTMQSITSPFDSVLRGAAYGLGYGALNKVSEGLRSSFDRYDIIKTFPRRMLAMGKVKEKGTAEKAIQTMKESVMGLPTGLDEMVDLQQRFVVASGNFKKSTKLAIAANNAFLAGGANALQREQGTRQLADYLSAGKLMESEWQSLMKSSPVMIDAIAKQMGYAGEKGAKEFKTKLKKNQIDPNEFFDALIKTGTDGGVLEKAAKESLHTFDAISSNIKNVLSDNGMQIIETLDEIFKARTGGDVIDNLMGFRDAINGIGEGVRNWIRANPDRIFDFVDRIKSFDWAGLGAGFMTSLTNFIDMASKVLSFFAGKDASGFGKAIVRINLLGKGLSVIGGLIKGSSWAFGLAGVIKTMRSFEKVKDVGKTIKTAEEVAEAGKVISKVPMTWQNVASKAVGIAAIPAAAGAMLLAAKALKEFNDVDISDPKGLRNKIVAAMQGVAAFLAEGAVVGAILTGASATPIGWLGVIAEGIGSTALLGAAKVMGSVATALNKIATAKIPDGKKISRVMKAMVTAIDSIKDLELPPLSKDAGERTKNLGSVFEGISSVANTLFNLSELDLTKKKIKNAKKKVKQVKEAMVDLKADIAEAFGTEIVSERTVRGGNNRGDKNVTTKQRQVADTSSLKEGVAQTGYIDQYLTNITEFVDKMQLFSEKMDTIKEIAKKFTAKGSDKTGWDVLAEEVTGLVTQMGNIIGGISDMTREKLKGSGDISKNLANVETSITSLITTMNNIRTLINENAGAGIDGTQIGEYINGLLTGISTGMEQVYTLSARAESFRVAAESVKSAVSNLQSIGSIEIDFGGFTATVEAAVKVIKDATKKIGNAWDSFKKTTDKIKSITKDISVTVNISGVDAAVQKMNSDAQRLSTAYAALKSAMNLAGGGGGGGSTSTPRLSGRKGVYGNIGGYIDGRGRVLYRSEGGGIPVFKRRGIDTVPAMLAPGEYVQNRRAVSHFGVDFMRRINHLDLEGALRSISGRAGRLAGNTVNITNNTNNAKVVQHIHTHDTNYTFKRANRFVEAL